MRVSNWISLIALVIILLSATQGVIQAKLYQLKVSISRDKLMNFELSSQALRTRFRKELLQNVTNYRDEIKQNLIEASILNSITPAELKSNILVDIGISISNVVRTMSLRPILRLKKDRELLLIIKYAFFMERNRHYKVASEKYENVIQDLDGSENDMLAFSLLHQGYCLSSYGSYKKATKQLKRTQKEFPGTHFSQTASVLLSLLIEREKIIQEIKSKQLNDLEKARVYYKNKIYGKACSFYEKSTNITSQDKFQFAYCSEEIGKQKRAIALYASLANSASSVNIKTARLANRRLLILGNLYKAGDDVSKLAKKNAIRLKDNIALSEIQQASKEQEKAVVIKEIIETLKANEPKLDEITTDEKIEEKIFLNELGKELSTKVTLGKEEQKELRNQVEKNENSLKEILKVRKEQEDKKRLAKEEERKQKEQENKERLAKEEEERKQKEQENKERLAKEEEERKRKALSKINIQDQKDKLSVLKGDQKGLKDYEKQLVDQKYYKIRLFLLDGRYINATKIIFAKEEALLKGSTLVGSVKIGTIKRIDYILENKRKIYTKKSKFNIFLEGNKIIQSFRIDFLTNKKIRINSKIYSQEELVEIQKP